jgi:hypothetical protein
MEQKKFWVLESEDMCDERMEQKKFWEEVLGAGE